MNANIEKSLESVEKEAAVIQEKEDENENRTEIINSSISRLFNDAEVCKKLEIILRENQLEKEYIQKQKTECGNRLEEVYSQLREEAEEIDRSKVTLMELKESYGEDVDDGLAILDERLNWLRACREKADLIAEVLETDLGSLSELDNLLDNKLSGENDSAYSEEKDYDYEKAEKPPESKEKSHHQLKRVVEAALKSGVAVAAILYGLFGIPYEKQKEIEMLYEANPVGISEVMNLNEMVKKEDDSEELKESYVEVLKNLYDLADQWTEDEEKREKIEREIELAIEAKNSESICCTDK